MLLGKGKPSTDHQFEGADHPVSQFFTPSGFHQLFLQRFGRPIVGQLEYFRLKDEDILLLSRGIMFHFRFHAMRVVGC